MATANIRTGFGGEVHKGKPVKFVLHALFGKIQAQPESSTYPFIVIPKCMGIRVRVSLDHLYQTTEPVTCKRCS